MARFAGPRRAYETGEHKPPVSLKRLVLTGLACPGRRRRLVGSLPLPPSQRLPSARLRYPLRLRGELRYLRLLRNSLRALAHERAAEGGAAGREGVSAGGVDAMSDVRRSSTTGGSTWSRYSIASPRTPGSGERTP